MSSVTAERAVPGFWLTVVCVNWGRGYDPGEFRANVLNVIEHVDGREHVVLLPQELDEDDPAPEHAQLAAQLEPGSHKVGWGTHEPIVLSPPFEVRRERVVKTMGSGLEIGAPQGTGPRRHVVSCIGGIGDLEVGFGNTHPHRRMLNARVVAARALGRRVFRREMTDLYRAKSIGGARLQLEAAGALRGATIDPHAPLWARFHVTPGRGLPVIWGADQNATSYPRVLPQERTAIHRGLDYIRFANHH